MQKSKRGLPNQSHPMAQKYYEIAERHLETPGAQLFVLSRDQYEAFKAWEKYFIEYLRWIPSQLQRIYNQSATEMTVPAEFPYWMDEEYARVMDMLPPPPPPKTEEEFCKLYGIPCIPTGWDRQMIRKMYEYQGITYLKQHVHEALLRKSHK